MSAYACSISGLHGQTIAKITNVKIIGNGSDSFPNILNNDYFGSAVADVGDLDGDGIDDLAVGAATEIITSGVTSGSVYILFMKKNGVVKSYIKNKTPAGVIGFGVSIANIGDIDGDGINDLAIGAYGDKNSSGISYSGDVYICFLDYRGYFKSTKIITGTSMPGFSSSQKVTGPQFGKSVGLIGDYDGDSINDIIVGCPQDKNGSTTVKGSAYIIALYRNGTVKTATRIDAKTNGFAGQLNQGDNFGSAVAGIGDFDGDGKLDIAVGNPGCDDINTNSGAIYLIFLNEKAAIKSVKKISDSTKSIGGWLPGNENFGSAICFLNDFGYSSNTCRPNGLKVIAVGASYDNDYASRSGAVWLLFFDSASRHLLTMQKISGSNPAINTTSNAIGAGDQFGTSICNYKNSDTNSTQRIFVGAPNDYGNNATAGTGEVYMIDFRKFEIKMDSILIFKKTFCSDSAQKIGIVYENLSNQAIYQETVNLTITGKDTTVVQKILTQKALPCSKDTLYVTLNYKLKASGPYKIKISLDAPGNFNPAEDSAYVTVNLLPKAYVIKSQSVCSGEKLAIGIAADSGHVYKWTSKPVGFASSLSNPFIVPDSTALYYLTEKNTITGCVYSDSTKITVNYLPTVDPGKNQAVCAGGTAAIGSIAVAGHTYQWKSKPTGYIFSASDTMVKPSQTITYYLKETIQATGCQNADSVTITVGPLPAVNTGTSGSYCKGTRILLGEPVKKGYQYIWTSNPSGFKSNQANMTLYADSTKTYHLTEKITATGCTDSDSVYISVKPKPTAKIYSSASAACVGSDISFTDTGSVAYNYNWYFEDGDRSPFKSHSHHFTETGSTQVLLVAKDQNGCSDSAITRVFITPLPNPKWYVDPIGNTTWFHAIDSGFSDAGYRWQLGDSNIATGHLVSHNYKDSGMYLVKLYATNDFGCSGEFDSTIYVKITPLSIMPNPTKTYGIDFYPNPFSTSATLSYSLAQKSEVQVSLYDIAGHEIQMITNQAQAPGPYQFEINAEKYYLLPGIYLLKVIVDGAARSKHILKIN